MNHNDPDRAYRQLLRRLCGALLLIAGVPATAATFVVTSTADTGGNCNATPTNCTLRQAITSANGSVVFDTINFNIPGSGVHSIVPATPLPTITRGLTINGYSQPGSAANSSATNFNAVIRIQISGSAIPTAAGLTIDSALGVTLQGMSLVDFGAQVGSLFGTGIVADGAGSVLIGGCAIGATPSFAAAGNRIGIRITPNQTGPVSIGSEGDDATARANRNLIVDSDSSNILADAGTGVVRVFNNLIGTHPSGTTHLGTQSTGINILRTGAIIRGNTIKGSTAFGIVLQAAGFTVTGNTIGRVNADLSNTVSNGVGIRIQGSASGQGVIGGAGPLANVIARSLGDAIEHAAAGINADMALNTFIRGTGQRLIDLLGVNGPDTNDAGDGDSGPNGLQNVPLILSATRFVNANGEPITITGSLNSLPNRSFRINFYSNITTLDDVATEVTTDPTGNASFGPIELVFPGENVVAIDANATLLDELTGLPIATSEFDDFGGTQVQTIAPPVPLIVNSTADPGNGVCDATECTLREAITVANGNFNPQSIDLISFAIPGTAEQVHVIQVQSPLPAIDEAATIDGYTQSGASPNDDASGVGSNADLKIVLAGGNFHFSTFVGSGASVTLRGLSITGFIAPATAGGLGIGSLNGRIEGCWFGVRPDGSEALTDVNVSMQSLGGVFGGDSPAQRNVFVNRRALGLNDGRATNNLFGVLPDGRTAASVSAVVDFNGNSSALRAMNTRPTVIDNNVFSTPVGIPAIIGTNTQIIDNAFGESWDGASTFSLGSALRSQINTLIRSSTRNIRGALNNAIQIETGISTGSIIIDQPILGGLGSGVEHHFASSVSIRSTISGTAQVGIDLNIGNPEPPFGVTANDIHPTLGPDPDIGGNGLQNFPELVSAFRSGGTLIVSGILPSLPNQDYRILICGVTSSHPSGHGGCETVLDDQTIVTTDGAGLASFTLSLADNPAHQFVTASASRIITPDVEEQTSEFALNIAITTETALFADSFE